jgi:hypothetical protein
MGGCEANMRGRALHWLIEERNSYQKLMFADLLKARYVITYNGGEFWLHLHFEGKDPIKTGPFSDPWQAMERAEKMTVKAMADGLEES